MYITELMEDWNKINLIEREFKDVRNDELNNTTPHGEIIIQTTPKNKNKLNCLADTGSPRSFIDIQTAEELIQKDKNMKQIHEIQMFQQQGHTNHRSTPNGITIWIMDSQKLQYPCGRTQITKSDG